MSKKDKKEFALAEDFQAITKLVPKLEALIKAHKEIAAAYHKFRKNGGEAIPGIEKHLGAREQESAPEVKPEKTAEKTETKAPGKKTPAAKAKKNVKA